MPNATSAEKQEPRGDREERGGGETSAQKSCRFFSTRKGSRAPSGRKLDSSASEVGANMRPTSSINHSQLNARPLGRSVGWTAGEEREQVIGCSPFDN